MGPEGRKRKKEGTHVKGKASHSHSHSMTCATSSPTAWHFSPIDVASSSSSSSITITITINYGRLASLAFVAAIHRYLLRELSATIHTPWVYREYYTSLCDAARVIRVNATFVLLH